MKLPDLGRVIPCRATGCQVILTQAAAERDQCPRVYSRTAWEGTTDAAARLARFASGGGLRSGLFGSQTKPGERSSHSKRGGLSN